jgi:hypothetical protein
MSKMSKMLMSMPMSLKIEFAESGAKLFLVLATGLDR